MREQKSGVGYNPKPEEENLAKNRGREIPEALNRDFILAAAFMGDKGPVRGLDSLRRADVEARFMLELQLLKFEANKHKDPWWLCNSRYLCSCLRGELEEIEQAFRKFLKKLTPENAFAVVWEVADMQNFGTFLVLKVLLWCYGIMHENAPEFLLANHEKIWPGLLDIAKMDYKQRKGGFG